MYKKVNITNCIAFLLLTFSCWSQGDIAPILTASGNQGYCPQTQINVVTDFNVEDEDDTGIESMSVQVSTGYVDGEDFLTLDTTGHPTIMTTWDEKQGKLTLEGVASGDVLYTDFIAAIKDVMFESTSANPTSKDFSITVGSANYLPSTDHYYEYIEAVGIDWESARIGAEGLTYFGLQGYLATVTSEDEAQFTGEQAEGSGWLGGTDEETEGVWKWVTGPEGLANGGTGTIFWDNWTTIIYENWNPGQPDNQHGGPGEDYIHVSSEVVGNPGEWNDLRLSAEIHPDYRPQGLIVEYGGMPNDPDLQISASTSIGSPTIIDTTPAGVCLNGSVTIAATASLEGEVLWYDALTGGTQLGTGSTLTIPTLTSTTTYYATAIVNGCLVESERVPVIATVVPGPIIDSVTGDSICASQTATITASSLVGDLNWYDVPTGGTPLETGSSYTTPNLNTTTIYYVDVTENGCTSSRTAVTVTVQETPMPTTTNSTQSFCEIDNPTLLNLIITGNDIQWYSSNSGGVPLNTSDLLMSTTYYASQTINGCESTDRLPIEVLFIESVVDFSSDIPDLNECDSMLDGDDTNGYTTFDLTSNEVVLLNGNNASDFTFTYFTDAAYSDLISVSELTSFTNTEQFGQIIYVRVENISGCYSDTSFNLIVNELPVINPSVILKYCDEDGNSDGFTNYNLTEANDDITNDNSDGFNITYYLAPADANSGIAANAITVEESISFSNSTASLVYARVENDKGCFRVSTIDLQVPAQVFPVGYTYVLDTCDDDDVDDGRHLFDLTEATNELLTQFPLLAQDLSVYFYKNFTDAQDENEITGVDNYETFSEVLYVRIKNDDTGECFAFGPYVSLVVYSRPEFEVDQSDVFCLGDSPIILETSNPKGNYTYQWQDDTGAIISVSPNATVASSGTYTVIATSVDNGCESFPVSFNVVESAKASISIDDITIVELSSNNSISINTENDNLGIGDYEFALDNINGFYQDAPFFDRVGPGLHTLYVRDKGGCGIESLDIFVIGFPKFLTPNNDSQNDTWQVIGVGTNDFTNTSKVTIYDRYGKLIKQLNAKNGVWDGTFNGHNLSASDYWFVADLVKTTGEIITYRGHFSLIR